MAKYSATKKQRFSARDAVLSLGVESGPWECVEVQAMFFHKTDRRRDGANFNAMLKGAFDGIVDAGLVSDDDWRHWTTLPPAFGQDKENPRVELTITRVV